MHMQPTDFLKKRPCNEQCLRKNPLILTRTATTHIMRQLISGDNSYQFEKATTRIKRQLISIKTHIRKIKSV